MPEARGPSREDIVVFLTARKIKMNEKRIRLYFFVSLLNCEPKRNWYRYNTGTVQLDLYDVRRLTRQSSPLQLNQCVSKNIFCKLKIYIRFSSKRKL